MIGDKPVNLSTLTDISQFLQDQNSKLDEQMIASGGALQAFMINLDQLLSQVEHNEQFRGMESRINLIKETTNEV